MRDVTADWFHFENLFSSPLLGRSLLCLHQMLNILRHLPSFLEGRSLGERLEPLADVREFVQRDSCVI